MAKWAYSYRGENEREKTIEEFLPVIKHLAYKISKGFEDNTTTDDLIASGITGLLEAIGKYDASRGVKLKTFAYLRIRGAMIDELRAKDWFSRNARSKSKKIEEVIRKLVTRLGRHPEEEEIAQELNISLEDYLSLIKDFKNLYVLSLEEIYESVGEGREKIIGYVVDETNDPSIYAEFHEIEGILAKEIDKLPEKQKMVLSLYYYEDMNMKEIAAAIGITEARVSQIHSQAILNLRSVTKRQLSR
ncbi:MAG: FliA/WhiG family RNA polymerase sigma factor [Proteobacteria bacterium]|nr:FliA/WhiG family RNA polymerase sigma factor [Pseudomonadota bacterium]